MVCRNTKGRDVRLVRPGINIGIELIINYLSADARTVRPYNIGINILLIHPLRANNGMRCCVKFSCVGEDVAEGVGGCGGVAAGDDVAAEQGDEGAGGCRGDEGAFTDAFDAA